MNVLEKLLDMIILANSWRAESDAIDQHEDDDYMDVFHSVLSNDFEAGLFEECSNTSMSRQSSMMSICYDEPDDTAKIMRKSSMEQQIVAVSRRHNIAHVNAIGWLPQSLKTYENQFE